MPLKLDAEVPAPALQGMGAEGGLSCWDWCRVDIPRHRGVGGHSQGPSGLQSSRNLGAVRFGIASIPVSLQCQLLPPAQARFGAWGPFCSHFTQGQWSGDSTLFLAWEWLQHCSCTPSRQEGTQQHQISALHPQPPPHGSPHPQPHTNTHSHPISFTQHPMATTPASCESWQWNHELPGVLQSCPSLLLLLPSTVMDVGLSAQPPFLLLTRLCSRQPRAGSRAHFPRASAAGAGRILAHTSLPAAQAASAPPPPANKAQPQQSHNLSGRGKTSVQPQGEPGQHLEL